MQNVHVYAVVATCKEGGFVVLGSDTPPNACKNECPGKDGFQIPTWHL
jgi:hypothetical protein